MELHRCAKSSPNKMLKIQGKLFGISSFEQSSDRVIEFLTQFPSSRYSCALELPIRDNFKATRFVAEFFTICCQIFLQIFHNLPPNFSPNMPKDFLLKGQLFSSESSDDCIPNQECNIYYHYVSLFPSLFNNIIIVIVKVIIIVYTCYCCCYCYHHCYYYS